MLARKSALRRYHTPFCSRLCYRFEIRRFGPLLSISASSSATADHEPATSDSPNSFAMVALSSSCSASIVGPSSA